MLYCMRIGLGFWPAIWPVWKPKASVEELKNNGEGTRQQACLAASSQCSLPPEHGFSVDRLLRYAVKAKR